jgi:hypothetical protein
MAKVLALPLPFEGHWSARQTAMAAREYIRMILHEMELHLRLVGPRSVPAVGSFLAAELLVTRFVPLFEEALDAGWCARMQRNVSTAASGTEPNGLSGCVGLEEDEWREMISGDATASNPDASTAGFIAALHAHFAPYAERVLALYRRVPAEFARLHVQNLVEEMANYAVQARAELLYPFLTCCVLYG